MKHLPFQIVHVGVPPIKCQGIKTKLVPFIFSNLRWEADPQARWIEPFLGSGVVAFNLAPQRALLADTNKHIIGLYQAIQTGLMNRGNVRDFLYEEGARLAAKGQEYYYKVRERFNRDASPFDFLFLNRSCFNGVMRFNRKGLFNVPFGHKPERFAPAYITKIVNQVGWVEKQMRGKEWEFRVAPWSNILVEAQPNDFVYLDPPYIGRHTDYFNAWAENEAIALAEAAHQLPCGFALSMWLENCYRKNEHLETYWRDTEIQTVRHFYHVGSTEDLRNEMSEALAIKLGFSAPAMAKSKSTASSSTQLSLYPL
jgi:DNA adenine methylase